MDSSPLTDLLPPRPLKRQRRTATSVLSGDFDPHPARDALTSLLNGVGPYKLVEKNEETRRTNRQEKKERAKERKRARADAKGKGKELDYATAHISAPPPPQSGGAPDAAVSGPSATMSASSFWRARPTIHIATMQRSRSITPPPLPPSPTWTATPGPSHSGSTSPTSSKRPYTPADGLDDDFARYRTDSPKLIKRKRIAVRKGWKGWVEGSPPPSEKLINLDSVPVLQERRTRSGKNFDAISLGQDGWV